MRETGRELNEDSRALSEKVVTMKSCACQSTQGFNDFNGYNGRKKKTKESAL